MAQSEASRNGMVAEYKAIAKFIEMGYDVLIPSTNAHYDMVVLKDNVFLKVQVKSTRYCRSQKWTLLIARGNGMSGTAKIAYHSDDVDFILAYVVNEDRFYNVPLNATKGLIKLNLPKIGTKENEFSQYLDNWGFDGA